MFVAAFSRTDVAAYLWASAADFDKVNIWIAQKRQLANCLQFLEESNDYWICCYTERAPGDIQ